jgi:hypothetical protein
MKNLKKALLILVVVVMALPACKKGANDPFISFKSRDARITATWKLTAIDGTESDVSTTSGVTTNMSTTVTYNGSSETKTVVTTITGMPTQTNTTTSVFTFDMTLDKRGVVTYNATAVVLSTTSSYTGNGSWAWLSNSKNRDAIMIALNGDGAGVVGIGGFMGIPAMYDIDQLKSKTLVLKNKTEESTTGSTSSSKSSEYTYTFEKQ